MWQLKQAGHVLMGSGMKRRRENDGGHGDCEVSGYIMSAVCVAALGNLSHVDILYDIHCRFHSGSSKFHRLRVYTPIY